MLALTDLTASASAQPCAHALWRRTYDPLLPTILAFTGLPLLLGLSFAAPTLMAALGVYAVPGP